MEKERDYKYDSFKALLIFLVVLGHLIEQSAEFNPACKVLYCFIYMLHMPAFIYVMGRYSKPGFKKAGQLLLLYTVFQFIYGVFLRCLDFRTSQFSFFTPEWITWFLLTSATYILISFLIPHNLSLFQKRIIFFFSVFLSVLSGFFPFIGKEFSLSRTLVFLPFFLLGKFEKEGNILTPLFGKGEEEEEKKASPEKEERGKRRMRVFLHGITAVFLTVLYYLLSGQKCAALWGKDCYTATGSTWYLRLIILAAALCWIRFLIEILPNKKLPVVTEMGKHTLFIYLIHGFVVKPLSESMSKLPLLIFVFLAIFIALSLYALAVLLKNIKRRIFSIKNVSQ